MSWETVVPFVLDVAKGVLTEIIKNQLLEIISPKENKSKLEITETEIEKKIGEALQNKHEELQKILREQHNDIEETKHLIWEIMSEIKTISRKNSNLEVGYGEISLSKEIQQKKERIEPEKLKAQLVERLEETVAERLTELKTRLSSEPGKDKSMKQVSKPFQIQQVEEQQRGLPPSGTIEVSVANNPEPKEKMSNYLENLQRYKEYGESILEGLKLIPERESWPDEVPTTLHDCIQRLKNAADTIKKRAASPIKIAVMGEVSSGKTLLVGSLIGYADGLPVSETPTTGNVTAIHLVQQEGFQKTKLKEFTVEYLSEEGVKECLRYMLEEAENRAKAVRLPSELILRSLQSLSPQNAVDCDTILKLCEQVWENAQNSELRYLIYEIVVFVNTYRVYGKDLCGSTKKIDDITTIKNGLKLDSLPENILELTFDQLPSAPTQWQNKDQPSAQDVRNSFSLIRCINVKVEVSKEIWDLSSLKGANNSNEFVLLDIPGLGSEHSGVRDTYLSLTQIEEVQTFLLLLNGKNPSSGTAPKIRTIIEQHKNTGDLRDRILVGVSRFNQLSLNANDKQKIDEFLNRPFLSEDEVLRGIDILNHIITSARNLTKEKDRIILISQLFGLEKLAQKSNLVEVCSPEFLPELEQVKKPEESAQRQKWQQLSEMLPSSQRNSTLGRQLSDFADDGGLGRLRSLLQTHVATHGIKQLYEDTSRAAEDLRTEQKTLKKIIDQIQDGQVESLESAAFTKLSQTINTLVNTYRSFKDNLREKPLLNRNTVAVSDVVKKEIGFRINNWNEWAFLFNKIQDGIIKLPSASTSVDPKIISIGLRPVKRVNNSIPMKSDDFSSIFQTTVEDIKKFALTCIEEAFKDLLNKLSSDLEQAREDLSRILNSDILNQVEQNFGEEQANLVNNLQLAADPSRLQKLITDEIKNITDDSSSIINSEIPFPLARVDDKHNIAHIFDWSHHKKKQVTPRPFNHEFLVLRLRSEMIASASLNLVQVVSEVTKKVITTLLAVVDDYIINSLEQILKNEALLKYIAAGDRQLQTKNSQFLKVLLSISSISYPKN
ncbi:hypothetical protein NUACC21_56100 [Scytonema sp. NUACC21]